MFFYASANFMISVFSYTIIIYIYVLLFFFNGFREEEVDRFSELREFLDKFFKLLFVITAFKSTAIGQEFSTKHLNVMMACALLLNVAAGNNASKPY